MNVHNLMDIKVCDGLLPKLEPKIEAFESVEIGIEDIVDFYNEEDSSDISEEKVDIKTLEAFLIFKESQDANAEETITESDGIKIKKEVSVINEDNQEAEENIIESDEKENKNETVKPSFKASENLGEDEKLILNFTGEYKSKDDSRNSNILYRTCETTDVNEVRGKVQVSIPPVSILHVLPHEYTRLDMRNHICNHCQKHLSNLKRVKCHIRKHHRNITTMYKCPYCPHESKWDLRYHLILRHTPDEKIQWFKCNNCDEKFKLKKFLTRHILIKHLPSVGTMRKCPTCDKVYDRSELLSEHIRRVHNKKTTKRYYCTLCDYSCVMGTALKHHIEVHHTNESDLKIHKCTKCSYQSRYTKWFNKHVERHRTQYKCDKCVFLTHRLTSLKLHMVIHSSDVGNDVMRYKCEDCDYKTHRFYSLQVHKLNHLKDHEIDYFYCYHCNFKAKRKDNLKVHVLRHFSKEDVELHCYVCDFSTKKRNVLTEHIATHSKNLSL